MFSVPTATSLGMAGVQQSLLANSLGGGQPLPPNHRHPDAPPGPSMEQTRMGKFCTVPTPMPPG